MRYYVGIDLHGNNNVNAIIDENDRVIFERRLANDLNLVLSALKPYRDQIAGLVVESTFNWYWLVDGLMDAGYRVHLANPAAIEQYSGLKYADDKSDAKWLAHMLRLGILPEGYIYPKEERPIRDLLRRRAQLVRQRTSNLLSVNNQITRNLGTSVKGKEIKKLSDKDVNAMMPDENMALSIKSNLAVIQCLEKQIEKIERVVKKQAKLRPEYKSLLTVDGIGEILAQTISLETGDINRFPTVGDYSSYCRTVKSEHRSNGKKKGKGNTKSGNRYLAWAFIEAATFAIRYNPLAKRFYQRKTAKSKPVIAKKALANKLARACYYIMRDQVPFDNERLFAT
jgi:transposase